MTFEEVIRALQDSEIDDRIKFAHNDMQGYFVKSELGEFIYYLDDNKMSEANFFLSDFDRDDWEIVK